MLYKFNTDNLHRARAALIIYALYKSRANTSSINGIDTWSRLRGYIEYAAMKAQNTAEFVTVLGDKMDATSIKPKYLTVDKFVKIDDNLIVAEGIYDYKTEIFEDDEVRKIVEREAIFIISLVRDRLNREKLEYDENEGEENEG